MADARSLKFIGYVFAGITAFVMLTAGVVVKGHLDGRLGDDGPRSAIAMTAMVR